MLNSVDERRMYWKSIFQIRFFSLSLCIQPINIYIAYVSIDEKN